VANRLATGGVWPTWWASAAGTPWDIRPLVSVVGSVLDRPTIISEKKMPMDSTNPEFWKVASMPEAAPRCRAGTLLMIAAALGAENRPMPTPATKMSVPKVRYWKSVGISSSPPNAAADTSRPPDANHRAPCRSDR